MHFLQKFFLALGMFTCVEEGWGGVSRQVAASRASKVESGNARSTAEARAGRSATSRAPRAHARRSIRDVKKRRTILLGLTKRRGCCAYLRGSSTARDSQKNISSPLPSVGERRICGLILEISAKKRKGLYLNVSRNFGSMARCTTNRDEQSSGSAHETNCALGRAVVCNTLHHRKSAFGRGSTLVRTRTRLTTVPPRSPRARARAFESAPAPHATMAPMTKAETAAANETRTVPRPSCTTRACSASSRCTAHRLAAQRGEQGGGGVHPPAQLHPARAVHRDDAHAARRALRRASRWSPHLADRGIFALVLTFFALLYAGMEVMKYAPPETFITVKSMTPVLFSACEYLFLGRALPNLKSTAAGGHRAGRRDVRHADAHASYHAYAFCAVPRRRCRRGPRREDHDREGEAEQLEPVVQHQRSSICSPLGRCSAGTPPFSARTTSGAPRPSRC